MDLCDPRRPYTIALDRVNAFLKVDEMSKSTDVKELISEFLHGIDVGTKSQTQAECDLLIYALSAAGYVIVPRLPTVEMERSAAREMHDHERTWTYESIWLAMISAAEKGE